MRESRNLSHFEKREKARKEKCSCVVLISSHNNSVEFETFSKHSSPPNWMFTQMLIKTLNFWNLISNYARCLKQINFHEFLMNLPIYWRDQSSSVVKRKLMKTFSVLKSKHFLILIFQISREANVNESFVVDL